MKKLIKRCLAVTLAFMLAVGMYPSAVNAGADLSIKVSGEMYYSYAFQVLDIVNKERSKQGLPALVMDMDMLSAAMERAAETSIYFDHARPDGSSCFTLFPDGLWGSGENIAAGQSSPSAVMDSWMHSPGHRGNILDESGMGYNVIGVGCYQAGNTLYWVQAFGVKNTVSRAKKSNYQDGKASRTIKADSAAAVIDMSISGSTLSRGASRKIQMTLVNQGGYGMVTLPNSQFTFKSSVPDVVSVSDKGVVKALKAGTAKIKASFKKGGKSAGKAIKITVR